ncbi:MAG: hypothetical protein AAF693_02390 [Bacteroidota bacterium]
MRNSILSILTIAVVTSYSHAQTTKGSIQLETGFTSFVEGLQRAPNTGFSLFSVDGTTLWSIGAEGGYFIEDNLALKAGVGYSDLDGSGSFSYKIGAKYYAGGVVPFQLDITGATLEDVESDFGDFEIPDPLYLGLQGGYAIFLADNISFEPSLRYGISLNDDFSDEGIFELRFGFVIFL